ncbi:amino acid permease [Actinosynnema sp. NPDC047251]|uniref:GABA permease n=1 Tax=Saccharothrix espanaensis (strain ATCC 51144 / DSM 44229 / JCM 9112 / NBRC 15066 / NRRL 15764) TaxID=1179773 RepID=K0JVP4_SACES|nr:amino acid permease [Saccharothrix espanaensis]CCH31930.1 GABA permease [Saccharothrix espanaensis DSM 44229]
MTPPRATPPPTDDPDPAGLWRALTGRQVGMIGLGGAIGTGLFLGSGLAISRAGPATIVAYAVCALVAFVIAWALAEMVVVHPRAGSFGAVAHQYLGPPAGFVQRWTYWTIQVIAVGGEVVAAGLYVRFWWPQLPLWLLTAVFSAVLLGANALAVRFFGTVEYWFAMVKVVAIVVFIGLGVVLITVGLPHSPATGLTNLTAHGGFLPGGINGLFLAMVFVLFSYIGTEVVAVTAAESERPERDIPRAARRMVLRLVLFYVLAIAVVLTVVPWEVTAQGGTVDTSPFVRVFESAGVPAAAAITNFVVLTAALSSANTNLYLSTRMVHSLAGDGFAPAWAGRLSPSGVPRNALGLAALGLALAAALSATAADTAYLVLFGISVFGALVVWIMILVTHWKFRRSARPASPVRLWGAPVTSGLAALFLAAVLVSTAFVDGLDTAWSAGVPFFAFLVVAYLVIARRRARAGGVSSSGA